MRNLVLASVATSVVITAAAQITTPTVQPEGACVSGRYIVDVSIENDPNVSWHDFDMQSKTDVYGWEFEGVIHVPPPDGYDDQTLNTWGHEFLHIVCGHWHKD